jgi:hypothetical protein
MVLWRTKKPKLISLPKWSDCQVERYDGERGQADKHDPTMTMRRTNHDVIISTVWSGANTQPRDRGMIEECRVQGPSE